MRKGRFAVTYWGSLHMGICSPLSVFIPLSVITRIDPTENLGQSLKKNQNWGGPTILKVAPCAHDTNVFAMGFRKSL